MACSQSYISLPAFNEAVAGLHCRCPVRVTGNPIRFGFDRDTQLTLSTIAVQPEKRREGERGRGEGETRQKD